MPEEFNWLAHTKFGPSQLRQEILARPRLVDLLLPAITSRALTLVSAPAGSGKTTLLASLPLVLPHLPLAWLTLDEEDNDPARFLTGLTMALQKLEPAFGQNFVSILAQTTNLDTEVRRLISLLINEIGVSFPQPFGLVLDDLHIISQPPVYQILDYLLEHLPGKMHLIAATRYDPPLALARLRARRQVSEVRLSDLRFTLAETGDFLQNKIGVKLTESELNLLQSRTEGWVAGISLSASFFENKAAQPGFMEELSHTNRYIFDFLAEEILNRQPAHIQDFLLQTSILPDLTPQLCQAVTHNENSLDVLEELYRHNLFLRITDVASNTYRYHDLFREFLQSQLERKYPQLLAQLHSRAAQAEPLATRAVSHYLRGKLWTEAVALISQVGEQILRQGLLDIFRGWLNILPKEILHSSPWLLLLSGKEAWQRGELNRAKELFEKALDGFTKLADQAGRGETLVYLVFTFYLSGDISKGKLLTEEALELQIAPEHQIRLLISKALQHQLAAEVEAVWQDLDAAIRIAETILDPGLISGLGRELSSSFDGVPGCMPYLERIWELVKSVTSNEDARLNILRLQLESHIYLWRGHWEKSAQACLELYQLSQQSHGYLWLNSEIGPILPLYYAFHGDNERADYFFDYLLQSLSDYRHNNLHRLYLICYSFWLARIRWHQGRYTELSPILEQIQTLKTEQEWVFVPVLRILLAGIIALSKQDYARAESLLVQAQTQQVAMYFSTTVGNATLWLAYFYSLRQQPDKALAYFEPVLTQCEHDNTPGYILWEGPKVVTPLLHLAVKNNLHSKFARQVLTLLGEPAEISSAQPELPYQNELTILPLPGGEELTSRELEILGLVVKGFSNNQIAAQLTLSLHTVKSHIAHILAKLEVTSRAQAIARVHELKLAR